MQKVAFHPKLMESILNGKKTATIRAKHRPNLKTGDAVAESNDGKQIPITIEEVKLTTYTWSDEAITSDILKRENLKDTSETGFHELFEALKEYYPDFNYDSPVTIIFFKLRN